MAACDSLEFGCLLPAEFKHKSSLNGLALFDFPAELGAATAAFTKAGLDLKVAFVSVASSSSISLFASLDGVALARVDCPSLLTAFELALARSKAVLARQLRLAIARLQLEAYGTEWKKRALKAQVETSKSSLSLRIRKAIDNSKDPLLAALYRTKPPLDEPTDAAKAKNELKQWARSKADV